MDLKIFAPLDNHLIINNYERSWQQQNEYNIYLTTMVQIIGLTAFRPG